MKTIDSDQQLEKFKEYRPELFNYVKNSIPLVKKFIVVPAPVKSGKRGMVEISSLLHQISSHVFVSAWHRTADKNQREELESFGIKVCSVNNKNKKNCCIKIISNELKENNNVIIHLDELDFGAGDGQLLSDIWNEYKIEKRAKFIMYSASHEVAMKEFLNSEVGNDIHICSRFVPPQTYFGIGRYLSTEKMVQAASFIEYDEKNNEPLLTISTQGKELIEKLKKDTKDKEHKRHIGILRLPGNFKCHINKEKKSISQFELMKSHKNAIQAQYGVRLKFVGSNDTTIEWDDNEYWEELESTKPFIIVINQVSGRSTEWKCHPYLCWYHTLRSVDTPIGTIIQDQERSVYYETTYDNKPDITVYGDVPCAQYSARVITLEQLIGATHRKPNAKLDTRHNSIEVNVSVDYYDNWESIPKEIINRRKKNQHVKKEYALHKFMTDKNGEEQEIKDWDKYKKYEGFYMTNIRGCREKVINNKLTPLKGIMFKKDIDRELKEGINDKSKSRINLYYEDGETNPENYKFIVRKLAGFKPKNYSNRTMYNT